jgi:Fe-S cluster assembly iron-binding protein IscA
MSVVITDEAADVLRRSLELGGIDPATGGIRLRGARGLGGGMSVQVELASEPMADEELVDADGVRVFVGSEVAAAIPQAIVTVEPQHETIVVRPAEEPEA